MLMDKREETIRKWEAAGMLDGLTAMNENSSMIQLFEPNLTQQVPANILPIVYRMLTTQNKNNMWNKETHKAKMKPHVDRLVSYFKNKGIEFSPTDGNLENVVFTSKDNEVKISHHSFYRYSGIVCVYKENKEKNIVETVEVTDGMFMDNFMKPIIELIFQKVK